MVFVVVVVVELYLSYIDKSVKKCHSNKTLFYRYVTENECYMYLLSVHNIKF